MPSLESDLFPPNFRDMLRALSAERVDYLLVGGYAMGIHGFRRATADVDFWVRPTPENAVRVMRALVAFGAPLMGLTEADLVTPRTVFQIGVAPERIDILTSVSGVGFDDAWKQRITGTVDGIEIPVIGRSALVQNKRASGRPKDRIDLDWLERHPPDPESA